MALVHFLVPVAANRKSAHRHFFAGNLTFLSGGFYDFLFIFILYSEYVCLPQTCVLKPNPQCDKIKEWGPLRSIECPYKRDPREHPCASCHVRPQLWSLNTRYLFSQRSRGLKSEIQVLAGLCSLWDSRKEPLLLSPVLGVLWLTVHLSSLRIRPPW